MTGKHAQEGVRRTSFNPLHEATQKLSEYARFPGRYRAKELIGLLSSQSDRALRIAQPSVHIHLYIDTAGNTDRHTLNLRLR